MNLRRDMLERPEGGSLNGLRFEANLVIKDYSGPLDRGHAKLVAEYLYLRQLPAHIAVRFAPLIRFVDQTQPRLTELQIGRLDMPSIGKAILRGLMTPERTRASLDLALSILLDELYPASPSSVLDAHTVYRRFHRTRLRSAVDALARTPRVADLVNAREVHVNGLACPTLPAALAWLDEHWAEWFSDARLVQAHGDAHLDNMLATTEGRPRVVFVDPRGELAMPPHYDAAKLHKAVTGGYDLIHYGGYSVSVTAEDGDVRIELSVDHAFDAHYRAGLDALLAAVPVFAAAEEVTEGAFVRATLGAAFAHQVSFSWYHAHHPAGIDTPRVIAYLAVASLMARRLLAHGPENPPSLDQQLL